jgi:hypothetical protein
MKFLLQLLLALACLFNVAFAGDVFNTLNNQLTISSVLVGDTVYSNVVITVGNVISVNGGTPKNAIDVYDPTQNILGISSVNVNGQTYTNVKINVGSVLSVGSSAPNNAAPATPEIGLALFSSTSLSGPWTKTNLTLNNPPSGAVGFVDPSPILMSDGTILLYYLIATANGEPGSVQANNQWQIGVAKSLDNGLSFTHQKVVFTFGVGSTDPFPLRLADGRIRLYVSQGPNVVSVTSLDSTGLNFPATADSGFRTTSGGVPGALLLGSTYYLFTCSSTGLSIQYQTSNDGLLFNGPMNTTLSTDPSQFICDPSPLDLGPTNSPRFLMTYKLKPASASGMNSDVSFIASSNDAINWTSVGKIGTASVPGLVVDKNGVYRVYAVTAN